MIQKHEFEYFLFDLDGTISESKRGITKSVQYTLKHYGIEVSDLDELECFIGPPLIKSFQIFYGFSEEKSAEACAVFRKYYEEKGIFDCDLYPGIDLIIEGLHTAGKKIYLATSKPEVYAEQILEHFGIAQFFEKIAGSNLDETRTDKAEVIAYLMDSQPEIEADKALMIGDRLHDIHGAHKHGIAVMGVAYGYGGADELKKEGAEFLAEQTGDLARAFHINIEELVK